jgi:hypothetical protein
MNEKANEGKLALADAYHEFAKTQRITTDSEDVPRYVLLGNMLRGRFAQTVASGGRGARHLIWFARRHSVVPVSAAAAYRSPRSLCEGGNCDQNHVHQRK